MDIFINIIFNLKFRFLNKNALNISKCNYPSFKYFGPFYLNVVLVYSCGVTYPLTSISIHL